MKSGFKEIPREQLDQLVHDFRSPLEIVAGETVDKRKSKLVAFDFISGKKLADLLLTDILSDLPKGARLIVVPDDCLGILPFEMLVLNSTGVVKTDKTLPYVINAEFFGDRNPLSYSQSITALTLARTLRRNDQFGDRVLVVADPVFDMRDRRAQGASSARVAQTDKEYMSSLMRAMEDISGQPRFGRLALAGEMAGNLERMFPGKADCFKGLDASREKLLTKLRPDLTQYGTIVFATHGFMDKSNPGVLEPVLVLSIVPPGTDGFLRMSDVMALSFKADLATLTACESGIGRAVSGEGVMGMGRAFQYAGAKSVLMSLWSVAEKSSVILVESFLRHRKDGKSKLEALTIARQEIRGLGYDHPFFWAPFILVGEVD